MILAWWTLPGLALASLPALLTLANLRFFTRAPRPAPGASPTGVSVLVPARDEARVIGRLAAAVLSNRDVDLELVILDDDSRDETAAIVSADGQRGAVRVTKGAGGGITAQVQLGTFPDPKVDGAFVQEFDREMRRLGAIAQPQS